MQYRVTLLNPQTGEKSETLWQATQGGADGDVRTHFQQRGLVVLHVRSVSGLSSSKGHRRAALSFSQEMKVLLESGLNIVEAIDTLAQRVDKSVLARVYEQLRDTLNSGKSLSAGLSSFPQIFPSFFVASVQAGEQSGDLVGALDRFIAYREKLDELRGRLVSAALYPMIVLGVSLLVILFLIGYVIPRFSVVFADMQDKLPVLTRGLLSMGLAFSNHQGLFLGGGAVLLVLGVVGVRQVKFRAAVWRWLSQRRLVRDNLVQYGFARLYRTLAMLVEAGIPFVQAMLIARSVLAEPIQYSYGKALENIQSGKGIAQCFSECQLTDTITGRILLAGERSGDVASALNNMARFIEQNLTYRIDRLAKVLEPVIMLGVGGLIGLIVVLMYSPIFELANAIQ